MVWEEEEASEEDAAAVVVVVAAVVVAAVVEAAAASSGLGRDQVGCFASLYAFTSSSVNSFSSSNRASAQ